MSHIVIGLTGGIGSGKTAVSDMFETLGIDVVDADIVARQVVAIGSTALDAIEAHFGKQAITNSGELDRQYLRERVFAKPSEKRWLDDLLHPLIRQQMVADVKAANSAYCILAVPLLVENNMMGMVDRVLVVDVDEQHQLTRAAGRDQQSVEKIQQIMSHQATRQQRLAVADDVIDNNKNLDALKKQVLQLDKKYRMLASNN